MTISIYNMAENIKNIIINTFNDNASLATLIIAMLPIFELRGAIPFGMSKSIWGQYALSPLHSFLVSLFGTTLVIPIVALIFSPLLKLLKKTRLFTSLAEKVENRIKTKSEKIDTSTKLKKIIGVLIFVSIPLPLTGVYTGTCIAVLLGLNMYEILLSVGTGNIIAGLIIVALSTILKDNTLIVLYCFIAILIVLLLIGLIKRLLNHKKQKDPIK